MKYLKLLIVSIFIGGGFMGCVQSSQSSLMPQNKDKRLFYQIYGNGKIHAPEWVTHPIKGAEKYLIAVVGTADYIDGSKRLKRMKIYAMMEARKEIAKILQTIVKIHNYEKGKDTIVKNKDMYREAIDTNSEEKVKIPLSGVMEYRSVVTMDGALHVQAVIRPDLLKQILTQEGIKQKELKNILANMKNFDNIHKNMIADAKNNLDF